MKKTGLMLVLMLFLMIPAGRGWSQTQDEVREYRIRTLEHNPGWIVVNKKQSIGAGWTTFYLRKDRVIAVVLEYPNIVTIKLDEQVEYRIDFAGFPPADQFVKDFAAEL